MIARISLVTMLVCATAGGASAGDRTSLVLWNAGGQAGMTLASAAIQHKIHSWRDVWRCLGAGSASGLGIYQAKSLVGQNHPATGWILANVAGSLSENAAAGRHPLAQIGYTLGPVRFRVSMPRLDRDARSWIAVDASVYEAAMLAVSFSESGRPRFRDGLIAFRDEREGISYGQTAGVFPATFVDDQVVWLHELTHAVQALQLDAAEPASPWPKMQFHQHASGGRRLIVFEQIKIGMYNFANDFYEDLVPYERRWTEIEAFKLTEGVDLRR